MANLGAYQKISRVLSGQPFGNGSDGAYSSATIPTLTKISCSGVATETHIHATAGTFVANDIILLHQTRGTGVGQWEIDKITADNGDGTFTVSAALNYTYTDSGASQAQAIKIPQYTSVTVQSGTWTAPSWDEDIGGIAVFAANVGVTVTGAISSRNGFIGGTYKNNPPVTSSTSAASWSGEGTAGATAEQEAANGNAGGGGNHPADSGVNWASGGGGGNATAGTAGDTNNGSGNGGDGGATAGAADLTSMVFGGSGGGGIIDNGSVPGTGSKGGGIVIIFSKDIVITGSIVCSGINYTSSGGVGNGGAGAGGSILIATETATLGTNLVTSGGGSGTGGFSVGGSGRIAVHHSGTVTGTSDPTFTDVTDTSLVGLASSGFFAFM